VKPLTGKTVLVTGAARRLGKAIALSAADAGAQVAITYLSSEKESRIVVKAIEKKGTKAISVSCDVRREDSIAQAVAAVQREFGRLDVLINNAGRFNEAAFDKLSAAQWDDIFATNVRGPFLVSQHCLPALRAARGRIINLGSLGGDRPWATHAHYCSSKAALHMLTRVMAKALAPEIAVNCVAPGIIAGGDDDGSEDPRFMKRIAQKTPMKRNGTTDDLTAAVMFFATATHFITGQIMFVDGGLGLD
jgi:3-oxoacyl-[acyl-carrier protein] reductase/pteridine reductase